MKLISGGGSGINRNPYQQNSKRNSESSNTIKKNIQTSNLSGSSKESKIGIIDDFVNNEDFDNDGIKDKTTHGDLVSSFTGKQDNIKLQHNNNESIAPKLEMLRKRAENGEKIGAINMSLGYEMSYDELSHGAEETITPANIKEKAPNIVAGMREEMKTFPQARSEIKNDLKTLQNQLSSLPPESNESKEIKTKIEELNWSLSTFNKIEDTVKTFDEIDKLAELGIPVIISSGNISEKDLNNGIERFNLSTLNEKAITVGSTNLNNSSSNGRISFFSNYNSLVDVNIQGIHNTNSLPEELSNKMSFTSGEKDPNKSLKGFTTGTSFSAPQAANYASKMHDKGASVEEINQMFQTAEMAANKSTKDTDFILNYIVNNQ